MKEVFVPRVWVKPNGQNIMWTLPHPEESVEKEERSLEEVVKEFCRYQNRPLNAEEFRRYEAVYKEMSDLVRVQTEEQDSCRLSFPL